MRVPSIRTTTRTPPNLTLNQAVERYGNPMAFVLSMVLLSGGLVATVGGADPDWLKQFDLTS